VAEYLRFEDPRLPDSLAGDLLRTGQILAPAILSDYQQRAMEYLTTVPGPNLANRKRLANDWLGYWIDSVARLKSNKRNIHSQRIGSLEQIGQRISQLPKTGFGTMATGEGTPGHRHFVDSAFGQVDFLCLAFEDSNYFDQNPGRRRPFLSLAARLSMWALYFRKIYVTVIPPLQSNTSEMVHYRQVFRMSQAQVSLASVRDPHVDEKITRGLDFPTSVPITDPISPHTSERTQKLMPDIEEELYREDEAEIYVSR
jgi:hypothetical protein